METKHSALTTKKTADVQPGDVILVYGMLWIVRKNVYDPRGNTASWEAPIARRIFRCDYLGKVGEPRYENGATDVALGFALDGTVWMAPDQEVA